MSLSGMGMSLAEVRYSLMCTDCLSIISW